MIAGIGKLYRGANEVTKVYLGTNVVYNSAVPIDSDARAYLDAISPFYSATWLSDIGKTLAQFETDTSDMFIALKDNLLYARLKAFYPMSGGTADSIKFNAKDPRNLDAAFRLTAFGSPAVTFNGIQGNGTTQYYSTHLNPTIAIPSATSYSHSVYSNSVVISRNQSEIGSITRNNSVFIATKWSDNNTYIDNGNSGSNRVIVNNAGQTGLILGSRVANNDSRGFVRGLQTGATQTIIGGTLTNHDLYLISYNNSGNPTAFSNRALQFAHVGDGMTAAEVAIFNSIVHTAQLNQNRGAY